MLHLVFHVYSSYTPIDTFSAGRPDDGLNIRDGVSTLSFYETLSSLSSLQYSATSSVDTILLNLLSQSFLLFPVDSNMSVVHSLTRHLHLLSALLFPSPRSSSFSN